MTIKPKKSNDINGRLPLEEYDLEKFYKKAIGNKSFRCSCCGKKAEIVVPITGDGIPSDMNGIAALCHTCNDTPDLKFRANEYVVLFNSNEIGIIKV